MLRPWQPYGRSRRSTAVGGYLVLWNRQVLAGYMYTLDQWFQNSKKQVKERTLMNHWLFAVSFMRTTSSVHVFKNPEPDVQVFFFFSNFFGIKNLAKGLLK
jgi:hypothetical protein